jgi:hypothetical protein
MAQFIVERFLAGITRTELMAAAGKAKDTAIRMSANGTNVAYLRSTFLPQDESCFCLFEGESLEAVQHANESAGLPFERIVEAVHVSSEDLI